MDNRSFTLVETGVSFPGGLSADVLMSTVRQAEADGFRSCWISEDYFNGGAMATAGALAAVTNRIELGVGVVNPYTRTPVLTAMEAAAVDAIAQGRFMLAMGSSNRRWIEEKMCIPFQKPITHVAESVEMIRTLIGTGHLDFEGQCLRAHNVELDFTPFRRDMPVYMGVRGERALGLAGEHADGVLLSIMSAAPYVAWAREQVDKGAARAGRTERVQLASYIPLFVGDREEGRRAFANTLSFYLGRSAEQPFVQQSGALPQEIAPIAAKIAAGEDAADLITWELADRFAVIGSPEHCRERLAEYRAAGLDQPILCACDGVSALDMMGFAKEILN